MLRKAHKMSLQISHITQSVSQGRQGIVWHCMFLFTSLSFVSLPAMRNATFQITPDVIKESETIQLGQDLKLSCHVDAVPQEKVSYFWYKNGKPAKISDRLVVIRNDPELPPVTSSLEIIDLRFTDYGTYLCVASFQGAPIPDLSVEVNISSETGEPSSCTSVQLILRCQHSSQHSYISTLPQRI